MQTLLDFKLLTQTIDFMIPMYYNYPNLCLKNTKYSFLKLIAWNEPNGGCS